MANWRIVANPACRSSRVAAAVPMREKLPSLTSVLDYLARCTRAAELANNRQWRLHYESVWLFVYTTTHGALPPFFSHPPPIPHCEVPVRSEVPRWKRTMLACPVRKVVRRLETVSDSGVERPFDAVVRLQLECGHIVEELVFIIGDKQAHRRRCKQCAKDGRAAAVIATKRQAASR